MFDVSGSPNPDGHRNASAPQGYFFKSVKVLRGREGPAREKWQSQGWEVVSQVSGPLRSELTFRKPKPKSIGAYLGEGYAAFRRMSPRTQKSALAALAALILAGGVGLGIAAALRDDSPQTAEGRPEPVATVSTTAASVAPPQITAPAVTPSPQAAASSAPPPATPTPLAAPARRITVDGLVDKINSGNAGKVGDRFILTAELAGSEYWMTGASGDFFVMLKTMVGSDLSVFVDESQASDWEDGTRVEMVVENVAVTIDDETTDDWFRAVSVKVL